MKTQKEMVLGHLQSGKSITSLEAWELYGCSRLSDVILKLRREGFHIDTIMVDGVTSLGMKATYGKYVLKGESNG